MAHRLTRLLELAWHPVVAADRLDAGTPAAVRLLGREVVVARLRDGGVAALDDRCLHRSTPLSIGSVDERGLRCAHHGWVWDRDGSCVEIPGHRGAPLPARARVGAFAACEAAGLLWVRLDDRVPWPVPATSEVPSRPATLAVTGVGALRRIEHLLEQACGSWSPAGAPRVRVERLGPQLHIAVEGAPFALGPSGVATEVTVTLPTAIEVVEMASGGERRWFWAAAVPVEAGRSALVWAAGGRGVDAVTRRRLGERLHAADVILATNRSPDLVVDHSSEVSVAADLVSVAYRRALHEASEAAHRGPGPLAAWLDAVPRAARPSPVAATPPMA